MAGATVVVLDPAPAMGQPILFVSKDFSGDPYWNQSMHLPTATD
jgi:hypothetical protein